MSKKAMIGTLGAALVVSALSSVSVQAQQDHGNPFAAKEVKGSFQVAADDTKAAEGKCGEKGMEGKCGEGKMKEGKCGEGKMKEGKCGEGKKKDGKCGEGKCGAHKDKAPAEAK